MFNQHSDGRTAHLKLNYRQVVGELLWVSGCTRLDISYAVTQLSKHCAGLKPEHFIRQMRRVLRYLRGTTKLDSIIMAGSAITCASKRQVSVATSSVQAEYQALSAAARE
ncbi:BQ5605_C007g04432 [Microbotryum silenes-dioicae]|uniref:BQ5605_C007g04432 protein n=1 Tax=Microbotryum silenes-dioicae TaxID=796604 RepID=A0A2X0P9E4_9BASI|nr:BQ5605_C007g04432 [Microbotryum silenes-dioicae]